MLAHVFFTAIIASLQFNSLAIAAPQDHPVDRSPAIDGPLIPVDEFPTEETDQRVEVEV